MSAISSRNFVPSPRVSVAGRRMSTWRVCTGLGFFFGTLVLVALMQTQGQAAAGIVVVAAGLLTVRTIYVVTRRFLGRVRLVLFEYLLCALAVTVLVLVALSAPVLASLDAWVMGVALGMAIGRVGCLMAGCCHGRFARRGVAYPWLRWAGGPGSLDGVALIPVQGYESALLALIFVVGLSLFILPHRPGDVLVFFLGAYGVGRFGLEFLRGDYHPYRGALSEAQWTCLALIVSIAVLGAAGVGDHSRLWLVWSGLSLSTAVGMALAAGPYSGPPMLRPLDKYDLDDFIATVRRVRAAAWHARSSHGADDGAKGRTRRGLGVAVWFATADDGQPVERYGFSGPRGPLDRETLAFAMCLAHESTRDGDSAWRT